MPKLIKYTIPFAFTVVAFSFLGFYPADCVNSKTEPACGFASTSQIDSCFFNGIPLHGKVQFVESFPDFTVHFVSSFPDLKVKFVSSFANDCGEWEIVESFPDFKVQVVESFPDIEIEVVESFPGLP